jgi:anti-sigma factor RsiW
MTERTGKPASDMELAALADGTLGPERRREIENQLSSSEQIRDSIQRQRAAIELMRETEVPASDVLHARVAEMAAAAAPARRRAGWMFGGFATAAAAAMVAIVLVFAPGSDSPKVDEVVAAAAQGPSSGAPAVDQRNPAKLNVSVGSVQFPTWKKTGWKVSGARTDQIGGRRVETVFYEKPGGATMKYSVVDGAPIDQLGPAATTYEVTGSGDTRRIVWRSGGHTCIIEARGVEPDKLERMIA